MSYNDDGMHVTGTDSAGSMGVANDLSGAQYALRGKEYLCIRPSTPGRRKLVLRRIVMRRRDRRLISGYQR